MARGRSGAGLSLLVAALVLLLRGAECGTDGPTVLVTPVTEAEVAEVCPNPDGNDICPVLVMGWPSLELSTQFGIAHLRNASVVSAQERAEGVTAGFTIYNLQRVVDSEAMQWRKSYLPLTSFQEATVSFSYTQGALFFDLRSIPASCGVNIDTDDPTALRSPAEETPITFSLTNSFANLNCILGHMFFQPRGGSQSSERQLSEIGGISSLKVEITKSQSNAFLSTHRVSSIFNFQAIVRVPSLDVCPSQTYPETQVEGGGGAVSFAREDLKTRGNLAAGMCFTPPMSGWTGVNVKTCVTEDDPYSVPRKRFACTECGTAQANFFYVYEDSATNMVLKDMSFSDKMYFYGSVKMGIKLKFDTGATPEVDNSGSKPSAADEELASWTYCADPTMTGSSPCAASSALAFAHSWVPGEGEWGGATPKYSMRILPETTKALLCVRGSSDCPDCFDSEAEYDEEEEVFYCVCTSGVCYTLNSFRPASSKLLGAAGDSVHSRNWFEVYEISGGAVVQRGYIDLFINTSSAGGTLMPIEEKSLIYGYPMNREGALNWFRFSPLNIIAGTYNSATRVLDITAYTSTVNIARLNINVRSGHGSISLPISTTTPVAKGGAPYPNHDLFLSNNMREINVALSRLQYKTNTAPHYNTQVKNADGSNRMPDTIDVTFDKSQVNIGPDPANLGNVSVFRFGVSILAANDAPIVRAPSGITAVENVLTNISFVSIHDEDADEVLQTEAGSVPTGVCPPRPGEAVHVMAISLKSLHGHIFVNDTGIVWYRGVQVMDRVGLRRFLVDDPPHEIMHRLMQPTGDVACGLDDLLLCIDLPADLFNPRPSRVTSLAVFVGAFSMSFGATLPCANHALLHLRYRGEQDYNNQVSSAPPSDRAGCALGNALPPSAESLTITADDQGYTGCVKGEALKHSFTIRIDVLAVEQAMEMRGPEVLHAMEDVALAFSSFNCARAAGTLLENCGALQALSRDNGDVTILDNFYEMELNVLHGTLSLSQAAGITYWAGDGTADRRMVLYAKLCALNVALRSLTYTPDPNFNTAIKVPGPVGGNWTNLVEHINVTLKQASGGPTLRHIAAIIVSPIDDPATVVYSYPVGASPGTDALPRVATATSDVYFCGGTTTCTCPEDALACVKLEDVDACEAKWDKNLVCNAEALPAENPTLIIETEAANVWFFDGADLARAASCDASDDSGCRRASLLSDTLLAQMDSTDAGSSLHRIAISAPLPVLQSGVLRLWSSTTHLGADSIKISLQDPASASRADYGTRVQDASPPASQGLESTFCKSVPRSICSDLAGSITDPDANPIPGVALVPILLVVALVVALCMGLFPLIAGKRVYGRYTETESLEEEEELDGDWVLVQTEPQRPYWYHFATDETVWDDPYSAHVPEHVAAAKILEKIKLPPAPKGPSAAPSRPPPGARHKRTPTIQDIRNKTQAGRLAVGAPHPPESEDASDWDSAAIGDTPVMRQMIAQAKAATLMKTFGEDACGLREEHYEQGATTVGAHFLPTESFLGEMIPQEPTGVYASLPPPLVSTTPPRRKCPGQHLTARGARG